jgi:TRAP-type transport system periplasmic protein
MAAKIKLLAAGMTIVSLLFSFTGISISAETKQLKLAYIAPIPVWGWIADKYSEEVAKRLPGLEVKGYGNKQLGNLDQMLAGLKRGKLDLMLTGPGPYSNTAGGQPFSVMWAPFLFNSQEHFYKFLKSDLFKVMMANMEQAAGVKYIGYVGDRTPRSLTTANRKVVKPEDLKGLKMRVVESTAVSAFWRAAGTNPAPIPASELYLALKQGVVDGQENGWDLIISDQYYDVQKYVIPINYVRLGLTILASEEVWKKLSKNEQQALLDATIPTAEFVSAKNNELILDAERIVKEHGMEIVEPDIQAFKKFAEKIVEDQLDGKEWPAGLYRKIKELD